ncbi:unnamed protein product [Somion occarium]|uniref:Uncharacterized protein n=1 Tax=Somion occarium TaxID=3059160 RepID=A0ABP1CEK9_9APHY
MSRFGSPTTPEISQWTFEWGTSFERREGQDHSAGMQIQTPLGDREPRLSMRGPFQDGSPFLSPVDYMPARISRSPAPYTAHMHHQIEHLKQTVAQLTDENQSLCDENERARIELNAVRENYSTLAHAVTLRRDAPASVKTELSTMMGIAETTELPGLANELEIPELNEAHHPTITYWSVGEWNQAEKARKSLGMTDSGDNKGKRGGSRAAEGENVMMPFMQAKDGRVLDGYEIAAMRSFARGQWEMWVHEGKAPAQWKHAPGNLQEDFYRVMCEKFPAFKYCQDDWKCKKLVTYYYPDWISHNGNHVNNAPSPAATSATTPASTPNEDSLSLRKRPSDSLVLATTTENKKAKNGLKTSGESKAAIVDPLLDLFVGGGDGDGDKSVNGDDSVPPPLISDEEMRGISEPTAVRSSVTSQESRGQSPLTQATCAALSSSISNGDANTSTVEAISTDPAHALTMAPNNFVLNATDVGMRLEIKGGPTPMNLCKAQWGEEHPNGTKEEFQVYWKQLGPAQKKELTKLSAKKKRELQKKCSSIYIIRA